MSREHMCRYQDPLTCMNSVMTWKRFPHYWPFMVIIRLSLKGPVMRSSIVCSTVDSGADQRKHQSSASLAFVRGTHRSLVNSPHKGPVTRKKVSIWWRHHATRTSTHSYILWCMEHTSLIHRTYIFPFTLTKYLSYFFIILVFSLKYNMELATYWCSCVTRCLGI